MPLITCFEALRIQIKSSEIWVDHQILSMHFTKFKEVTSFLSEAQMQGKDQGLVNLPFLRILNKYLNT